MILCFAAALIWGITNWFLKRGSTGLQKIHYDSRIKQFGAEIWYFFTNAQVRKYGLFQLKRLIYFIHIVLDSVFTESVWFGTLLL